MQKSGFFTAELQSDGTFDRVYVAEEFAKYFSLFVGTGVFVQPASQLMVVQADTASMKVKVKAGNAFINGYWYNNDSFEQFIVPTASGALDRWDAIMLRHDYTSREIRLSYVTGTPAITPSKPQPERSQDAYELCIAHIFVGRGVLKITDANITDTRPDSSICGYVKGLVETVNTTDLFAQFRSAFNQFFESGSSEYTAFVNSMKAKYNSDVAAITEDYDKFLTAAKGTYDSTVSEYFSKYNSLYINNENSFNNWFETIKGKLSTDIAGSLQNQIDALKTQIGTASGSLVNLPTSYNGGLLLKELQDKSVQNGTPSPSTKADIVSVGDNGDVVLGACGKNLLDFDTWSQKSPIGVGGTITWDIVNKSMTLTATKNDAYTEFNWNVPNVYKIPVKPNTTYTFSWECVGAGGLVFVFMNGVVGTGQNLENTAKKTTFTTKADTTFVTFRVGVRTNGNSCTYSKLQIEESAVQTTYEQFKEQLITIPLTQPLRSVGSVYDRIIKKNGIWGVERNIATTVLRSIGVTDVSESIANSEFWRISQNFVGGVLSKSGNSYNYLLCDRITITKQSEEHSNPVFNMSSYSHADKFELRINAPKSLYPTKESVVAFLNSVTWNFIYALQTPTFEPFSQSLQDQLNKLLYQLLFLVC